MSEDFVPISSNIVEKAVQGWAIEALEALSADSQTIGMLDGLDVHNVRWIEIAHDLETSRHTPDNRDTYFAECLINGDSVARFTVDIVHDEVDVDRFGHAVFFDITYQGHDIQGSVSLPLNDEHDRPFVHIWSISNT